MRQFNKWKFDFDYLKKLNKEEKEILITFFNETENAYVYDNTNSLFLSEEKLTERYIKLKNDKKAFAKFKKDLSKENNKRKIYYKRFKERYYKRFIKCVETQSVGDLKRLNKLYETDYTLPLKISNYNDNIKIPTRYRVVNQLTFLKNTLFKGYNNALFNMRECIMNRDLQQRGAIIEDSMNELVDRSDTPIETRFLQAQKAGKLKDFIEEEFEHLVDLIRCENKDNFINGVYLLYLSLKNAFEDPTIRLTKRQYLFKIYKFTVLIKFADYKNDEALKVLNYLTNIFQIIVFPLSKNLKTKRLLNNAL